MKRYVAMLLSVLLLLSAVPMVSADGPYNDDEFNWGEYACPHSNTKTVEAVASTCTTAGHGAYTRCTDCGVVTEGSDAALPLAEHAYVPLSANPPTCTEDGWERYYCVECGDSYSVPIPASGHAYFSDCESVCMNCYEETREASHHVIHVAAKDSTCTDMGNIEYWYCDACGAAWLDADCTRNTNLRAVVLPLAEDHVYDDDRDADCNLCGYERSVAVAGDANGDGDVNNRDMALLQQYINGWDVSIDAEAIDVNDDGDVNNRDLALLQQFINGWDVILK